MDNPSQMNQESPLKLPLAPIVSTPPDRRGNAAVSTRRGSAIFSPTQTLDHHHLYPPQHHRPLSSPPPRQQPVAQREPTPDPDPAHTSAAGASNSTTPPPPPPPPAVPSIRYRECLKNHAASMGGHVVDGCGEFMPSGEEGTAEALRCAACDCHRNFHRKEAEGAAAAEAQQSHYYYTPSSGTNTNTTHRTPSFHHPPHHLHHHHYQRYSGPTPPTMVNFGGGAAAESSSEDLNMVQSGGGGSGGHAVNQPSSRKRFRTKFSQEQKDRMQEFAEKLGWRIQKQDDQEVEQFCNESGIKRQVFKVWMHNNKQASKKRQI